MAIRIFDFEISQWAEDHFSRHRITREQIYQILENRWVSIANRKGRAADYLVIGRDSSGRCIAVPVMPTDDPTVWRPVSAWYCKQSEAAKLR